VKNSQEYENHFGELKRQPLYLLLFPLILIIMFSFMIVKEVQEDYVNKEINKSTNIEVSSDYVKEQTKNKLKTELESDIYESYGININIIEEGNWIFTDKSDITYIDYQTPIFTFNNKRIFVVYSYVSQNNEINFITYKFFNEGEDPDANHR